MNTTPRPWRYTVHTEGVDLDRDQYSVSTLLSGHIGRLIGTSEEDADLIVRAVNSYDDDKATIMRLDKLCHKLSQQTDAMREALQYCVAAWDHDGEPNAASYEIAIGKVRAALALVEGKDG